MAASGRIETAMSEETFDYNCNGCEKSNKTIQAAKYCIECKLYFCQPCTDIHKHFPLMADHSFMDIGQVNQPDNQTPSLPEFPTERCCSHKGKVRDMYCKAHDEVGCYVCMATGHKSCLENQLFSVPDMLDTLFNVSDCERTQSRLQQIVASMTTLSVSKDTRLEALKEAKKEAIGQIDEFHGVLEQILKKAAECSKKEVIDAYSKLEADVLQDKENINKTNDVLKTSDEKLTRAARNRAQRFVCSKVAEKNIKKAESEIKKQETDANKYLETLFRPDHSLKHYLQNLHGIGDVHVGKMKRNLYLLKSSKDINAKTANDSAVPHYGYGSCLTHDNQLILADYSNRNVKRIDTHKMAVVDVCQLSNSPQSVCCINQNEIAVGCHSKIQFVSIKEKMTPSRQITTNHKCYDIAMKNDNLYVTDWGKSLYVYDINGTLLKTINNDKDGNQLFSYIRQIAFNESGDRMFVGDVYNGLVCFDGECNYLATIKDNDLNGVVGVCTDGRNNVFVSGYHSNNVVQFNEDGKKIGVVVKQEDGLCKPCTISFHREHNRMFVSMDNLTTLKMYEVEIYY